MVTPILVAQTQQGYYGHLMVIINMSYYPWGKKGSLYHFLFLWNPATKKKIVKWCCCYYKVTCKNENLLTILSEICCVASDVISLECFIRAIFHFTYLLMGDGGSTISELLNEIASSYRFLIFSTMSSSQASHNPNETIRVAICYIVGIPKPSF